MGRTRRPRGGSVPAAGSRATGRAWAIPLSAASLVVLGLLVYANTFSVPFLQDDLPSIVENPYIRDLWPLWRTALAPPNTITTARPLVGLSLALNYAAGGLDVRGYHAVNITVHLLAALVLFGIVRRTLLTNGLRERFGRASTSLAFVASLLWMVHPLQTEAVNYVSQRTESMMGLFYLLTLYCAIRAADSPLPGWPFWPVASLLACAAGVASKQVIVTAPVMVALWDWAYSSEPYGRVFAKRWRLYAALASTWVFLGVLMWLFRDTNVGAGVSSWDYARAQCIVIVQYLRRAVWPTSLLFDYGLPIRVAWTAAAPYAAILALLAVATAAALIRQPTIGFLGAWVFVVLAPTSSFVPLATEVGAERRMYLPLAGIVVLAVTTGYWLVERIARPSAVRASLPSETAGGARWYLGLALIVPLAGGLGGLTLRRNAQYRYPVSLWSSAVEQMPQNWRAHNNLGVALEADGRAAEGLAEYRRAIELNPRYEPAHHNLAQGLYEQGSIEEAISHYRIILEVAPTAALHTEMGVALEALGNTEEAIANYQKALALAPEYADAHLSFGRILFAKGDIEGALGHYRDALQNTPGDARTFTALGTALFASGQTAEAIAAYGRAIQLADDSAEGMEARRLLAWTLGSEGRIDDATIHYRRIFDSAPNAPAATQAHRDLADLLLEQRRFAEAIDHYRLALERLPNDPRLRLTLGVALGLNGRNAESLEQFERAVGLAPEWPEALIQLANALALRPDPSPQDMSRAVEMAERAVSLTDRRNPAALQALEVVHSAARALRQ